MGNLYYAPYNVNIIFPADLTLNDLSLSIKNIPWTDIEEIKVGYGVDDSITFAGYWELLNHVSFKNGPISSLYPLIQKKLTDSIQWSGTSNADTISGGSADDILNGNDGDDVLTGGGGNDLLSGGAGNDTYVFNVGDGVDHIQDTALAGESNTLAFGAGISASDISLGLGSLLLRIGSNGDAIHLDNFDPNRANGTHAIEYFRFADGTELSYAQLLERGFDLYGTAGDDVLGGTNLADRMLGQGGNDTYQFGLGSGADSVLDLNATPDEINTVRMGEGVSPDNIAVSFDGLYLNLTIDGTSDSLSIRWDPVTGYGVQRVEFSDGTVWGSTVLEDFINTPPVLVNTIPEQIAAEDQAFFFRIPADTFADADAGDALSYFVAQADGSPLPAWLSFDEATGTFGGIPGNSDVGALALRVTATDKAGTSASAVFDLTVANVNDAPQSVSQIADLVATEDVSFSSTLPSAAFADVDAGDTLAYSATLAGGEGLPAWLNFDAASLTFSGTPGNADVGSWALDITATDQSGASANQTFHLDVANVNDAPTAAEDAVVVDEDFVAEAMGNVLANDVDIDRGDTLRLTSTGNYQGQYGLLSLQTDGSYRYLLNNAVVQSLAPGDVATDRFAYTATDGTVAVGGELTVTIAGANDAPLLTAGFDTVTHAARIALSRTLASDAFSEVDANDALHYTVMQADGSALPSWLAFDAVTRTLSGTPEAEDAGTLRLNVTATDTFGASASGALELNVFVPPGETFIGTSEADTLIGTLYDDVFDGREGADVLIGKAGDDLYLIDRNRTGDFGENKAVDRVVEMAGEGFDTVWSSDSYALPDHVEAVSLLGKESLWASGNELGNLIAGNRGDSRIHGLGGDDLLLGGAGNDRLYGDAGNDALDGGNGNDWLEDGAGSGFIAGGKGQDTIRLDQGPDVVAFNRGDGKDHVEGGDGQNDALSLGGGIHLGDLKLGKDGKDLVLTTGGGDQIRFDDWYRGNKTVSVLQIADSQSTEPNGVHFDGFDFAAIVADFDHARDADKKLAQWTIAGSAAKHRLENEDGKVFGGGLAAAYARNGNLDKLRPDVVAAALASPREDAAVTPRQNSSYASSSGIPSGGHSGQDEQAQDGNEKPRPIADPSNHDYVPFLSGLSKRDWNDHAVHDGTEDGKQVSDPRIDYAVTWARLRDQLAGRLDADQGGAPVWWDATSNSQSVLPSSGEFHGMRGVTSIILPGSQLKPFEGLREGFTSLR